MLGDSSLRQGSEAILFFYLSEKSVVFILFLNKLDKDNNLFPLGDVGGSHITHLPPSNIYICARHVSALQARETHDCFNCPLLSSSWDSV